MGLPTWTAPWPPQGLPGAGVTRHGSGGSDAPGPQPWSSEWAGVDDAELPIQALVGGAPKAQSATSFLPKSGRTGTGTCHRTEPPQARKRSPQTRLQAARQATEHSRQQETVRTSTADCGHRGGPARGAVAGGTSVERRTGESTDTGARTSREPRKAHNVSLSRAAYPRNSDLGYAATGTTAHPYVSKCRPGTP